MNLKVASKKLSQMPLFYTTLLKCWYSDCYYNQNLTVSNSPKLRGLPKKAFPSVLKQADTTHVFKKKSLKKNYRLVSILPVIFKIFEKLIC